MGAQLLSVLLIAAAPLGRQKADEPVNPYQNAKVGDYAVYTMTTKVAGTSIDGSITQTVTAKDSKTVTIETVAKLNGIEVPGQKQVIDLTKPFDPTSVGSLPAGTGATVEKLDEGKEKMKVGAKEYDTRWEAYKVTTNAGGMAFEANIKVWQGKGLAMPIVKMEMSADVVGNKMEMTMELTETGNNAADKKESKK
jgi:hypothetical protein